MTIWHKRKAGTWVSYPVLPNQDSPILTRELLYTAITRARERVEIWGRKEIFHAAVERRIKRTSGLADKLWGEGI